MKKLIAVLLVLLVAGAFVFAKECKDHGYYDESYCPKCSYNKGFNAGSAASSSGSKYNDRICRTKEGGNYIQPTRIPETNQNKIKDCVDGYKSAYGEMIWCETCKANFPVSGHTCKK